LEREVNFQQTCIILPIIPSGHCRITLQKLEVFEFWQIWKKCKRKCNMHSLFFEHTPDFNALSLYLLTRCFNFRYRLLL